MLLLGASVFIPSALGQTLPTFEHVVIVLGENQNYGISYNSTNMPYLTSLANTYGLGVNYYSDTHPSIGNYLNLATGNILTDDDGETPESFPVSKNNTLWRFRTRAKPGRTMWRAFLASRTVAD